MPLDSVGIYCVRLHSIACPDTRFAVCVADGFHFAFAQKLSALSLSSPYGDYHDTVGRRNSQDKKLRLGI
jgi:hypothetical protein